MLEIIKRVQETHAEDWGDLSNGHGMCVHNPCVCRKQDNWTMKALQIEVTWNTKLRGLSYDPVKSNPMRNWRASNPTGINSGPMGNM